MKKKDKQYKEFLLTEDDKKAAQKDELEFIFSQAEKQLKECVETSKVILNRATIFLTLTVGFIVSDLGYLLTKWEGDFKFNSINLTSIITCIYLIEILFLIRFNVKGHGYKTTGSEPVDLLHSWFFYTYQDSERRLNEILISETQSYQRRIEDNKNVNENRWNILQYALNCLILLPVFMIICFLFFNYLGF